MRRTQGESVGESLFHYRMVEATGSLHAKLLFSPLTYDVHFCTGLHYETTNPISIKVGRLSKNAIKTKICNFFIHLNLYLTDKMTKQIYTFKYRQFFKLIPATHSKKVGTEACLPLGNITFSLNYTLKSFCPFLVWMVFSIFGT